MGGVYTDYAKRRNVLIEYRENEKKSPSTVKLKATIPLSMTEEFHKIIKGELCPYCYCETKLVSGESVFPNKMNTSPRPKYLDKMFYQCINDSNHYVGTYSNNIKSLGRLADSELRILRNKGHKIFDPLWKEKKVFKSQKEAYKWPYRYYNY